MSVMEQVEEQELRETKYPLLRVLTGGKGPPEEPTTNWLKDFIVGTVFACRVNKNTVDWEMYHLVHKFERIYLLMWELPDGKVWERRVDPIIFSKLYKDFEVIAIQKKEELEALEGETNGDSNRPDQSGGLVLHETVQRNHQPPEVTE